MRFLDSIKEEDVWIETSSGRKFTIFNPRVEDISLLDIAKGLGNKTRFAGQMPHFYSVAQHSVLVAAEVGPNAILAALLHDAAEAYWMDVPTPVKRVMPELVSIENRIQDTILKAFNVQLTDEITREVHVADRVVTAQEVHTFMHNVDSWADRLYEDVGLPVDKNPKQIRAVWSPELAFSVWYVFAYTYINGGPHEALR